MPSAEILVDREVPRSEGSRSSSAGLGHARAAKTIVLWGIATSVDIRHFDDFGTFFYSQVLELHAHCLSAACSLLCAGIKNKGATGIIGTARPEQAVDGNRQTEEQVVRFLRNTNHTLEGPD